MESTTKSVSFTTASASDPKYERIQTQIPIEEDALAASPIVASATTNTTTTASFLRRRSSIVTTEQQHTLSTTKSHFENDDDLDKSPNHSGGGLWEYTSVLSRHPPYRAYLASHLCQQLGDHFVRIANVLVVEELAMKSGSNNGSGSALAHVTLARLLPNAVFALVGGVLADKLDKRRLMVNTDCISGVVVLGYLLAMQWESLGLLYGVTIVRNSLSATYYPSASGILPDLVAGGESNSSNHDNNNKSSSSRHHRDLQLAVTLNSWAWGGSVIVGGLLAGKMAAVLGLQACYFIDCATYWMSAVLIAKGIKPDYNKKNATKEETNYDINSDRDVYHDDNDEISEEAIFEHKSENHSLFGYLMVCGFGWMVFAKPSASLVWGIEDIVGAQFATVFSEDGTEDTVKSSVHMGLLFSTIGLGCSIGPILLNTITDARKPYTLQRACWIGLMLLGLGWLLISFVDTFPQFLMGSFIRTMGSGAAWVYSSLILQTLCDSRYLGRVLALEHTLTTLFEAATSFVAGTLSTSKGLSDNQLALGGAGMGLIVVIVWGVYYALSLGAAHPRFNSTSQTKNSYEMVREMNEIEMGNRNLPKNNNSSSNTNDGLV